MAVLVEGISVVVRLDAIAQKVPGGWNAFKERVPNQTLCADNELARVGFMTPDDVKSFVSSLQGLGLIYREGDAALDMVVVDQLIGPLVPCVWIEYGHTGDKERVAARRLAGSSQTVLMRPEGWKYEGSLSQTHGFVPTGAEGKSVKFLRKEDGVDVYLNLLTGTEMFVGRTT
jgi:hypothetical protein